jgi:hypothetical protein
MELIRKYASFRKKKQSAWDFKNSKMNDFYED